MTQPFRLPILLALALLPLLSSRAGSAPEEPFDLLLRNLPWRSVGPAIMGGRINDFAVDEKRPATFYVATASSGIFKTVNKGTTWEAVFDSQTTSSIGDVTLAPSDPRTVWAGTGEANNRQSSSWGNGVYKSTDAGRTWTNMGLAETMHVGRIVIDPRNADVVYVAANGRLWGPNRERGVFKTADGGKTWAHSLAVNEDTGCTDLVIDPRSPDTLYAAAYQRRRTAFGFNGGGPGSGIYKSTDAGGTWKKLSAGLPSGDLGRIGLDLYRKDPRILYALIESATSGLYRSEDGGETWRRVSATNPRPMYFSKVRVDPNNDQRLWVLGVALAYSENGGRTFTTSRGARVHADFHAMWIDPADSEHVLAGCDGGIQWTYDAGRSWDYLNSLPLAQFYEIGYDFRRPYWVYGGLQDNGSWAGPSATLTSQGPTNEDWVRISGADGFYVQVDPTDANVVYSEGQNGTIGRLHRATGERKSIQPRPPAGEPPYRWDWNTPLLLSPHDHRKLYAAANRVFISTDRGDSWRRTEDLSTRPDRTKMPIMGAMPGRTTLSLNDGQSFFGQVVTLTESPVRAGLLYAGTDDGNLQVSRDDGLTWRNVVGNVPGVPPGTYVSRIVASTAAAGRAYAAFDGHRSDDFKPYLFVTEDFGQTWKPISAGLPEFDTVSVVREHPRSPDLLFLGTERGLWVSFDRGGRWTRFGAPLPTVPVDDIQIHPRDNDLILGTHGRGIWILDDIAPLEQLAARPSGDNLTLFRPRTAVAYRFYNHKGTNGHRFFVAPNPPAGAVIQYLLREKLPDGERVKITVLDRDGKTVVRELTSARTEAGVHRIPWDLRHTAPLASARLAAGAGGTGAAGTGGAAPPPTGGAAGTGRIGGTGGTGGAARAGGGGAQIRPGPRALPGTYLVRVTAGREEQTVSLRMEEDPRLTLTSAERRAHFDLDMRLNDLMRSAGDLRTSLQALRTQLTALQASPAYQTATQAQKDAAAALSRRVTALLARIGLGGTGGTGGTAGANPRAQTPAPEDMPPAAPQNPPPAPAAAPPGAGPVAPRLQRAIITLESVTEAPPKGIRQEAEALAGEMRQLAREVTALRQKEVPAFNRLLDGSQVPPLKPEEMAAPVSQRSSRG